MARYRGEKRAEHPDVGGLEVAESLFGLEKVLVHKAALYFGDCN